MFRFSKCAFPPSAGKRLLRSRRVPPATATPPTATAAPLAPPASSSSTQTAAASSTIAAARRVVGTASAPTAMMMPTTTTSSPPSKSPASTEVSTEQRMSTAPRTDGDVFAIWESISSWSVSPPAVSEPQKHSNNPERQKNTSSNSASSTAHECVSFFWHIASRVNHQRQQQNTSSTTTTTSSSRQHQPGSKGSSSSPISSSSSDRSSSSAATAAAVRDITEAATAAASESPASARLNRLGGLRPSSSATLSKLQRRRQRQHAQQDHQSSTATTTPIAASLSIKSKIPTPMVLSRRHATSKRLKHALATLDYLLPFSSRLCSPLDHARLLVFSAVAAIEAYLFNPWLFSPQLPPGTTSTSSPQGKEPADVDDGDTTSKRRTSSRPDRRRPASKKSVSPQRKDAPSPDHHQPHHQHPLDVAHQHLSEAIDIASSLGAEPMTMHWRCLLAFVQLAAGHRERAREMLTDAAEMVRRNSASSSSSADGAASATAGTAAGEDATDGALQFGCAGPGATERTIEALPSLLKSCLKSEWYLEQMPLREMKKILPSLHHHIDAIARQEEEQHQEATRSGRTAAPAAAATAIATTIDQLRLHRTGISAGLLQLLFIARFHEREAQQALLQNNHAMFYQAQKSAAVVYVKLCAVLDEIDTVPALTSSGRWCPLDGAALVMREEAISFLMRTTRFDAPNPLTTSTASPSASAATHQQLDQLFSPASPSSLFPSQYFFETGEALAGNSSSSSNNNSATTAPNGVVETNVMPILNIVASAEACITSFVFCYQRGPVASSAHEQQQQQQQLTNSSRKLHRRRIIGSFASRTVRLLLTSAALCSEIEIEKKSLSTGGGLYQFHTAKDAPPQGCSGGDVDADVEGSRSALPPDIFLYTRAFELAESYGIPSSALDRSRLSFAESLCRAGLTDAAGRVLSNVTLRLHKSKVLVHQLCRLGESSVPLRACEVHIAMGRFVQSLGNGSMHVLAEGMFRLAIDSASAALMAELEAVRGSRASTVTLRALANACESLGYLLLLQGRPDEAHDYFKRCLRFINRARFITRSPDIFLPSASVQTRFRYAVALESANLPHRAKKVYQQLITSSSSSASLTMSEKLATTLRCALLNHYTLGNYSLAAALYFVSLTLDTENPHNMVQLAWCMLQSTTTSAPSSSSSSSSSSLVAGGVESTTNETDHGGATPSSSSSSSPTADVATTTFTTTTTSNEYLPDLELIRKYYDAAMLVLHCCENADRLEPAGDPSVPAMQSYGPWDTCYVLGECAVFYHDHIGDIDTARRLYEKALSVSPEHTDNYAQVAANYAVLLCYDVQDLDAAGRWFEAAVRYPKPHNEAALVHLFSEFLLQKGKLDKAATELSRVAEKYGLTDSYHRLAKVEERLLRNGSHDFAVSCYCKALGASSRVSETPSDDGLKSIFDTVDINTLPIASDLLLMLHHKYKNVPLVDALYRKLCRAFPLDVFLLVNHARFLNDIALRPQAALRKFRQALKVDRANVALLDNLAEHLAQMYPERLEIAERCHLESVRENPHDPQAHFAYACFLSYYYPAHELAEQHFHRALELDKRDTVSLCSYAAFLEAMIENNGPNWEAREDASTYAEQMYQEAIRLSPTTASHHLQLACFLWRSGRLAEAWSSFEASLELDRGNVSTLRLAATFLHDWLIANGESTTGTPSGGGGGGAVGGGAGAIGGGLFSSSSSRSRTDSSRQAGRSGSSSSSSAGAASSSSSSQDHQNTKAAVTETLANLAESFFQRALSLDARDVATLKAFGSFFEDVRRDSSSAQGLYTAAAQIEMEHALAKQRLENSETQQQQSSSKHRGSGTAPDNPDED